MASQIGYKARAYRGASQIEKVRKITPADPSVAKIDATHLESTGRTKEYVQGFIDYPEAQYECVSDSTSTVQAAIESDYLTGVAANETWSHQLVDPTSGTALFTYTYTGYISKATRGPLATEELVVFDIAIQLASSVVRT